MLRLAVRVRHEHAEVVLAELLELAPSGVEELEREDGVVEYVVYGAPGELPALPDLKAAAGGALVDVATSEIADDWDQRWRQFHRPLVLGEALAVRPPWAPPQGTTIDVVIDPGPAFGTGSHATTRLCMELMLTLEDSGGPFLDLGCGSGVLAIVAARLGFVPVVAVDNDPAAVEAARENARRAGVEVEVRQWDLRTDSLPDSGTVVANLLGPLLRELAARLAMAERFPERLIASGLLVTEADQVGGAFAPAGLREQARRTRGDWAALLLERG
jgi:ribosomal protein L11 methyltransferase